MQSAQPTPVDVFLRTHPDRGGLRVQVTCGGGRFPVAGAQVVISRAFGTEEHIFYRGVTDGSWYPIRHPPAAPPFAWSQASDTAAISGLDYQVSVQHPCSSRWLARTATVFDGVETILPVMLEPVV